jgi:hypothetical protein
MHTSLLKFRSGIFSVLILISVTRLSASGNPGTQRVSQYSGDLASISAQIDVNNINMWVQPNGLYANDPTTGNSGLEYPKGSEKYRINMAGFSVIGKPDPGQDALLSATAYFSSEYEPGVILSDGRPDNPMNPVNKVYKVNAWETVPAGMIELGGPSQVIGDQMLYTVFNDANSVSHTGVFQTLPVMLEVHLLAWAYHGLSEALENTVFFHYRIINKNTIPLYDAYVAFPFDVTTCLGDYVGCDPDQNLGYTYRGANDDYCFGENPPVFGCSILQGPLVPSLGENTRLIDGRVVPDFRSLGMTAFVKMLNGSTIFREPRLQSYEGAIMAYNAVRGFQWDGSPSIDPVTGDTTTFMNSGDPITGEGWLASHDAPAGNYRMWLSSGPFTLAPGDTQSLVIALIYACGADHLYNIRILRQYNEEVREFFSEMLLQRPENIPAPEVDLAEMNREIRLKWGDKAADFESAGFSFEGYNVYEGDSEQGPWTRIITFDLKNNIKRVIDRRNEGSQGLYSEYYCAEGSDSGLKQYVILGRDHTGNELVNGRPYYYAVTAYAVNPDAAGIPKVIESAKQPVMARPHAPDFGTELPADTSSGVPVLFHPADGTHKTSLTGSVTLVDPYEITGHDYRVDFVFADSGPDSGFAAAWNLTDLALNQVVLAEETNMTGDDEYPVIDGLVCRVKAPEPGAYGFNHSRGIYAYLGPPYSGFSYTRSRTLTGVDAGGESFYGGLLLGEDFQGSTCTIGQIVDVRIDFVSDRSVITRCSVQEKPGYAFKGIGTFPGAAYDISDPDHPRRLNLCFVEDTESNAPDMKWNPIAAETGDGLGGREYLYVMASDYIEDPSTLYNDSNPGRSADVIYGLWAAPRDIETFPTLGDWSLTIYAIHPVKPGDYLTFSTEGLAPVRSAEIAERNLDRIQVYPNPYFGYNPQETDPYGHFVTFINLPEGRCTLRIFSLSGQLIRTIEHNNGTVFDQWDLCNESDLRLRVASGMYIVHIDVPGVGTRILKLAVISPRD